MNEIANRINRLESQKAGLEQALEALRDFGETGNITPGEINWYLPAAVSHSANRGLVR